MYNTKLNFFTFNGVNLTHFADVKCDHSYEGDFIDEYKGIDGDAITHAKNDVKEYFKVSQICTSPHWGSLLSAAKNHTQCVIQWADNNTGETFTSTTAYVKNLGNSADGGNRDVTIYCEDVS